MDSFWKWVGRLNSLWSLVIKIGLAIALTGAFKMSILRWFADMSWEGMVVVTLFSITGIFVVLQCITWLLMRFAPGRATAAHFIPMIPSANILLQGTWRKAYTWQGKPGAETADIKADSYYLEGETQPRFWLRDVTYNPTTREVRLKLVSVGDGIVWDTETLTLSPDERHMVGRSERFGHEVRYERQFDDDEHSGQGQ